MMTNSWSLLYDTMYGPEDERNLNEGTITIFDNTMNNDSNRYKYDEDTILKELQDYISGTYNAHYSAGDDKIQTLDLIEACGDGEACLLYTSPSPRDS